MKSGILRLLAILSATLLCVYALQSVQVNTASAATASAVPDGTQATYNDAVVGYALVRGPGTPDETFSYNRAGGAITVTTTVTGSYSVTFKGAASTVVGAGHPQVTAIGANAHCLVWDWGAFGTGDLTVNVACLDNNQGDPVNRDFSILVLDEGGAGANNPNLAFAYTEERAPAGGELDLTGSDTTYNPGDSQTSGQTILFHTGTGRYSVVFRNLGEVMSTTGHVQVTPVLSGFMTPLVISCRLEAQWEFVSGDLAIPIQCSDLNGNLLDAAFNVLVTSGEETAPGYAYALNDLLEPVQYTELTNDFVYNPWGAVEVIRLPGLDGYQLRFHGAGPESGGNFVVTPLGPAGTSCSILSWGASNADGSLIVRIRCFSEARTHVNAMFTVLSTFVDASPVTTQSGLYLPVMMR